MPNVSSLFRFMVKHPVATAAVGGGTLMSKELKTRGQKLEAEIMRNRLGTPGGKFVYSEFNEFATRKKFLNEKTAFVKCANESSIVDALAQGAAKGTATQLVDGVIQGAGRAARKIKDKMVLEPKREQILADLIEEDPVVSEYETGNPGATAKAFSSMRRFAPELSTDPNVVSAYLREAAQTGGAANYMTIKQLAETEAAINKAQGRS